MKCSIEGIVLELAAPRTMSMYCGDRRADAESRMTTSGQSLRSPDAPSAAASSVSSAYAWAY